MLFKFLTIYLLSLLSSGTNTEISDFQPYVNMEDGSMSIICSTTNTLYVDSSSVGGDGTSWLQAFNNLDTALFVAWQCPDIDTILVAEGTYVPHNLPYDMGSDLTGTFISNAENRDKTFHIRQGLNIYGGYPSGGGQRNFRFNKTILSGAGVGDVLSDSAYHVVFIDTSGYWPEPLDTTVLSGFEIIYGRSDDHGFISANNGDISRSDGSAIHINKSLVQIENIIVTHNHSIKGTLYSSGGSQNIVNSFFIDNFSEYYGSALYLDFSKTTIANSVFLGGFCLQGTIFCSNSTVNLVNNTIVENRANSGAGIQIEMGMVSLTNNVFWRNSFIDGKLTWELKSVNGELFTSFNLFQVDSSSYIDLGESSNNFFNSHKLNNPRFRDPNNIPGIDNILGTLDDGFIPIEGSPLINAGINDSLPSDVVLDIIDSMRVKALKINLGAYECSAVSICLQSKTLYVDSASIGGDGTSWEEAFNNLDTALYLAWNCPEIDSVLIAEGTYIPQKYPFVTHRNWNSSYYEGSNNRDKTFHIRQGLKVLGSYSKNGATRNLDSIKTVLKGFKIDGNPTDSAYHVMILSVPGFNFPIYDTTVISGFIINGGSATSSKILEIYEDGKLAKYPREHGGGIYVRHGTTIINRNIIVLNRSRNGGGVYINSGSHVISENSIEENIARSYGGGIDGRNSDIIIHDNSILNNVGFWAGGIYMENVTSTVSNNVISNNQGPGLVARIGELLIHKNIIKENATYNPGGGMYLNQCKAIIKGNFIIGNSSGSGGGLYTFFDKGSLIVNNVISNNHTYRNGAAIHAQHGSIKVINNTIVENSTKAYCGGIELVLNHCELYNNIFWNNSDSTSHNSIGVELNKYNSTIEAHSNLFQTDESQYTSASSLLDLNINNVFNSQTINHPNFFDPQNIFGSDSIPRTIDDGFILTVASAAIDKGTNEFIDTFSFDIRDSLRIQKGIVDMGAYEGHCLNCPCPATLNLNSSPIFPGRHKADIINSSGSIFKSDSVHFQAGKEISFQPGFNIAVGGVFEGAIETCNEMIPSGVKKE